MKALAVIVLLPLLSVVILSLYGMGGLARITGVVLLVISVAAALAGLFSKRSPDPDGNESQVPPKS